MMLSSRSYLIGHLNWARDPDGNTSTSIKTIKLKVCSHKKPIVNTQYVLSLVPTVNLI